MDIAYKIGNAGGLAILVAALISLLTVRGGRGPTATTLGLLGVVAMLPGQVLWTLSTFDVVDYFENYNDISAGLFLLNVVGLGLALLALVVAKPGPFAPRYPSGQFPMVAAHGGQPFAGPQYAAPQPVPGQPGTTPTANQQPPNVPPPPSFGTY